jgi:hypothetical protein
LEHLDESVATKQWDFRLRPTVAPLAYFLRQRQKCEDSVFLELLNDPLLMSRYRMDRKPSEFFSGGTQS